MVILKYELKRHRKYILGWAIALALCVFVMTPTYYSFMDVSTGDLYETLGTSDFYKGVGVSMEYLTSPLGIYAFLTSFFMIASGIFGMHFGIAIHTKECSERTSEYLFTKPHTRKTIYWAKAFTVFFGVVVVSMVYLLASFLALALFRSGIDWGEFFLIALSLMLVTLFLAAMGLLVGILFSRNRSPLLTAGLIVFVEYCVTSFSNIVSNRAISFLSPYSFFSAAEISKSGFYELDYLGWCVLLFASLFKSYKAAVRAGTVFVLAAYVLAFTAEYTGNRFLDYLTPLRYYDVYEVALNGVYLSYIVLTVLIVGACVMVSTRRWKLREL